MAITPDGTLPDANTTGIQFALAASGAGQILEPDTDHKTGVGFENTEKPKHFNFNFLFQKYGKWIEYFRINMVKIFETLTTHDNNLNRTDYGEFVLTFNGFTPSNIDVLCYWKREIPYFDVEHAPSIITLCFKELNGASSSSGLKSTNAGLVPTEIRPLILSAYGFCPVIQATDADEYWPPCVGAVQIGIDGYVTIHKGNVSAPDVNLTTNTFSTTYKGFKPFSITYPIYP